VLFCDLVDSTVLASQLDPEEWREVVRAYQDTCARVIARFEGHIAQYLGDGLLVYFGYPLAHEDDAQRAVRAGLGVVEAMGQLNTRLTQERGVCLAVRLGIHTGQVVVGEIGGGPRQEQLALGETPNLAARLQGIAAPNTVVISAATLPLLGGFFAYQALGMHILKGFAQPIEVYQVLYESMARSRLEVAGRTGLTPLVGREPEVALLLERWAQVKVGLGQVVLLSGEAAVAQERAEAQRALCTEQGFALYLAWGTIEWGAALAAQGAWAEGLAQMHQGVATYQAIGRLPWLLFLGLLAEACGRAGQVEEGLRALHEALEAMQTTEERLYAAEVYRLRGELLRQQSAAQPGEAEASFHQALTVARRQEAKSWELRAAMSLARLWQQQGKRAEAHALLAPIYGWFTEGFNTADLQEAKALLDEWS
jgi:class 3 adenylate cyclase